jgi:hypothetical protein
MNIKTLIPTISILFFLHNNSFGQDTKYNPNDFKENPTWINMMEDSTVNYYEAIKTFNNYWKGKIKPIEEMDIKDMEALTAEEKEIRKNYFQNLSLQERAEFDLLQYHYKRFKQWKKEILPFVQEDGRILTMNERIEIWNKQQLEIKNQK